MTGDKKIVSAYNEVEETKEGGESPNMCEVIDKVVQRGREEGMQEGLEQGREQGKTAGKEEQALESATKMIQKEKFSFEDIAECTGLSLEKVKALAEELAVAVRK